MLIMIVRLSYTLGKSREVKMTRAMRALGASVPMLTLLGIGAVAALAAASAIGGGTSSVAVAPAAQPMAALSVRTYDVSGTFDMPLGGVEVVVRDADGGEVARGTSDKAAAYSAGLPQGRYIITAAAGGYRDTSHEVTVKAGEGLEINLGLSREEATQ
jgi:hypothetical protein